MFRLLHFTIAIAVILTGSALTFAAPKPLPQGVQRVTVKFSEGHQTVGEDRGRPVVLIAAALGVKDEVFREAFSQVRPAGPGSGGPTEKEARTNKAALMKVLSKHNISNERLDEVSNYYRYSPGREQLWKTKPAEANALVKDGKVIGYEIVDGGAGYTTPSKVTVPDVEGAAAEVRLSFGKDFETNGMVSEITMSKK